MTTTTAGSTTTTTTTAATIQAAQASAPGTYVSSVLGDGPSLYWRYGEPSGTTIADSSGNGRTGEYLTNVFLNEGVDLGQPGALANDTDTAFGKSGTYLYSHGHYARALSSTGLPAGNSPRSVEGWVKFSHDVVMASWGGDFQVGADATHITVSGGGTDHQIPVSGLSLNDGKWHNVAVTYDGAIFTGFVDGEQVGSVAAGGALTTTTEGEFHAARLPTGSSSGYFDELAVYPRALTGAQIRGHFVASAGAWPIDESAGQWNVVGHIDGPARIRIGRTNRYWVAIENRGPTTVYGVTGGLRLPAGVVYEDPSSDMEFCQVAFEVLEAHGVAFDREQMLQSPICKPDGAKTTNASKDILFRVEKLGPGETARMPIDLASPTQGQIPLTLSVAPPTSSYTWTGAAADFRGDSTVKKIIDHYLPQLDPPPTCDITVPGCLDGPDSPVQRIFDAMGDIGEGILNRIPASAVTRMTNEERLIGVIAIGLMIYGSKAGLSLWIAAAGPTFPLSAIGILIVAGLLLFIVLSMDPNDKIAPTGYGSEHWIAANSAMHYVIRFENDPKRATAPAQLVEIVDRLSPLLDGDSLEFQEVVVGGRTIPLALQPDGSYSGTLERTEDASVVRVEATVEGEPNEMRVRIFGQGSGSGQDQYADFLPPNVSAPEGEGYVAFTVRPKTDTVDGAVIENRATIIFDSHEVAGNSLDTPLVTNRLDRDAPSSVVSPLPFSSDSEFTVAWDGNDGAGSGVNDFTVYVSKNGGPLTPWQLHTRDRRAQFKGESGATYGFIVQSRDNTGNLEPLKPALDASTVVSATTTTSTTVPPTTTTAPTTTTTAPTCVGLRRLRDGFNDQMDQLAQTLARIAEQRVAVLLRDLRAQVNAHLSDAVVRCGAFVTGGPPTNNAMTATTSVPSLSGGPGVPPGAMVSQVQIRPGQLFAFSGRGLAPNQPVRAIMLGSPLLETSTVTDGSGNYHGFIEVPANAVAGERFLVAATIGGPEAWKELESLRPQIDEALASRLPRPILVSQLLRGDGAIGMLILACLLLLVANSLVLAHMVPRGSRAARRTRRRTGWKRR